MMGRYDIDDKANAFPWLRSVAIHWTGRGAAFSNREVGKKKEMIIDSVKMSEYPCALTQPPSERGCPFQSSLFRFYISANQSTTVVVTFGASFVHGVMSSFLGLGNTSSSVFPS